MKFASPNTSLAILGLNSLRAEGVLSSGPYTAKLLGWSNDEVAVGTFTGLVDAIRWLMEAMKSGGVAQRADIYSVKGELVWTERSAPGGQLCESATKQNVQRVFVWQDSPIAITADDCPIAPMPSRELTAT